eukprot:m.322567 g.322567  ORF g.322567 m.322567 type:complete len:673 (-) comp19716_c0_seq5:79-2097(-)
MFVARHHAATMTVVDDDPDYAPCSTTTTDSTIATDVTDATCSTPNRFTRSQTHFVRGSPHKPRSPQLSRPATPQHRRTKSTDFAILRLPFAFCEEATSAELEKENKHFSMSEALISALEEANSTQQDWSVGSFAGSAVATPDSSFDLSSASVDEHRPMPARGLSDSVLSPPRTSEDQRDGDLLALELCEKRVRHQLARVSRVGPMADSMGDGVLDVGGDAGAETDDGSAATSTAEAAPGGAQSPESDELDFDDAATWLSVGSSADADRFLYAPTLEFQRVRSNTGISITSHSDSTSTSEWLAIDAAEATSDQVQSSSPESVARNFLRTMSIANSVMTPLELVVKDDEVPQDLLPMPVVTFGDLKRASQNEPLSELLGERLEKGQPTRLRGNDEWAPPRRQIIFDIRPHKLSKKAALAAQNHRCAGCGLKVQLGFVKRFRFCEYLGKYFCPSCHGNTTAVIPSHVLHRWDFARYRVCNFARDVLVSIADDPLFDVMDINHLLYGKSHTLCNARDARTRLNALRRYVGTCRLAEDLLALLDSLPSHISSEIHLYSLNELIAVKFGGVVKPWQQVAVQCEKHVKACPICCAKGFVCDFCGKLGDVLFPFDLKRAAQCQKCGDLFHRKCLARQAVPACPKCLRREKLRAQRGTMAAARVAELESDGSDTPQRQAPD